MARKLLLFHLLCFCCLFSAQATGQISDLIIIGKDTFMLQTCPIEHDSILSKQVSERLSQEDFCTACWRGYQATWQIEDDKLILKKIEDSKSLFAYPDTVPEVTVDLNGIFDQYQDKRGRIVASWFSGELKVVSGEQIYYVHTGFNREYENETDYQVEFLHNESFPIVVSTPALRQLIYNKTNSCLVLATVATSADKLFISTVFFDIFTDFPI